MTYRKAHKVLGNNFIQSVKCVSWNLDLFGQKDHNILFISGFSGSGKSTLSYQIQEKINNQHSIYIFELDGFENNYDTSEIGILNKYKRNNPDIKYLLEHNWEDKNGNQIFITKYHYIPDFINWVCNYMKNRKELFIIEGIQIIEWFKEITSVDLKNEPVILMGTSLYKSLYNVAKRNGNEKAHFRNIKKLLGDRFDERLEWYKIDAECIKELSAIIEKETKIQGKKAIYKDPLDLMNQTINGNIFEGIYDSAMMIDN